MRRLGLRLAAIAAALLRPGSLIAAALPLPPAAGCDDGSSPPPPHAPLTFVLSDGRATLFFAETDRPNPHADARLQVWLVLASAEPASIIF